MMPFDEKPLTLKDIRETREILEKNALPLAECNCCGRTYFLFPLDAPVPPCQCGGRLRLKE